MGYLDGFSNDQLDRMAQEDQSKLSEAELHRRATAVPGQANKDMVIRVASTELGRRLAAQLHRRRTWLDILIAVMTLGLLVETGAIVYLTVTLVRLTDVLVRLNEALVRLALPPGR